MNVSAWRIECGSSPDRWACIFAAMKYVQDETNLEITLTPQAPPVATVILLHGLGADGSDFVPIVGELGLPETLPVRFVFPHAPLRPVTVNNGYVMRAWYNIKSFTPAGRADVAGTTESAQRIAGCINHECARGVPSRRVVLSGFSQGGAVALFAGLRYPERLAGILAISVLPAVSGAARGGESRGQCRRAHIAVSRAPRSGGADLDGDRGARRTGGARLNAGVARLPDGALGVHGRDCGRVALAAGAAGFATGVARARLRALSPIRVGAASVRGASARRTGAPRSGRETVPIR